MPTVCVVLYSGNGIFDTDCLILLKTYMNSKIVAITGITEQFKLNYLNLIRLSPLVSKAWYAMFLIAAFH